MIRPLTSAPALKADFESWADARNRFNTALAAGDSAAVDQGWQRNYMHGMSLEGEKTEVRHATKRKLNAPRRID